MQSTTNKIIKRTFDILAAGGGLIFLSPLLALIALLLKIREPQNPIFFRQKRIGQWGRPFFILKFRTMRLNKDGDIPGNSITISNDPRFTPTGAFLNQYKLNELPQLWNIVKGDMSFVGPRPDVEGYADKLTGDDRKILQLKPGITGPATIKYRNEEELLALQPDPVKYNDEVIWPDKVKINLRYLDDQSLMGDLKIILKTLIGS